MKWLLFSVLICNCELYKINQQDSTDPPSSQPTKIQGLLDSGFSVCDEPHWTNIKNLVHQIKRGDTVAKTSRHVKRSYIDRSRTGRRLKKKLINHAQGKRRFVSKYIHVQEHDVTNLLNIYTDWSNLTLQERHRTVRQGRVQRVLAHNLYHKTLRNIMLTLIGKTRNVFSKLNAKTGLDNLVAKLYEVAGVDLFQDYLDAKARDEENEPGRNRNIITAFAPVGR